MPGGKQRNRYDGVERSAKNRPATPAARASGGWRIVAKNLGEIERAITVTELARDFLRCVHDRGRRLFFR